MYHVATQQNTKPVLSSSMLETVKRDLQQMGIHPYKIRVILTKLTEAYERHNSNYKDRTREDVALL